jgi:hypothetical protein
MTPASKRGRPAEIADRVELVIYLTRGERAAIDSVAQRASVSRSAWARETLCEAILAQVRAAPPAPGRYRRRPRARRSASARDARGT